MSCVPWHVRMSPPPRRAGTHGSGCPRHWIDVGRAYHYRADRDRALSSILEAERIAPHKTRINPAAREVVSHLLRSRRKNDLVELALRMGVA